MRKESFFGLILILLLLSSSGFAQTKSNLEVFYSLVDSSALKIWNNIPVKDSAVFIEFNKGNNYLVLENRLLEDLTNKGLKVSGTVKGTGTIIKFIIVKADLNYGNLYRKGFLGSYYIPRNIQFSGNFAVSNSNTIVKNFAFAQKDTVMYDSLKNIENPAFPFTQGEIPPEPIFSSLLEPVVAIGAAAAAVILFFTVRSK